MSPGMQTTGGPQRMKANWKTVETKCLTCSGPFTFGEEVCICPQCGGTHHAGCWDSSGGCMHQAAIGAARGATMIEGAMPPPPPHMPAPAYGPPPLPPLPVHSYTTPPPVGQPQPLAADEQYCPKCGNVVKTNAVSCPYCQTSFAYAQTPVYGVPQPYGVQGQVGYPGVAPGLAQAEIAKKASSSLTCGLISLITIVSTNVFSFIVASSESPDLIRFFISIRPVFAIVGIAVLALAIVAVVKASGAKRLMYQFPVDPGVRSKATAGQVMGWITLAIGIIGIALAAARGGRTIG